MFRRLFDSAAPLWRAASTLGDIIVVNALLVLTALPIVTAGAGLVATYDTARRVQAGIDDGAARTFWRSFRANFRQATLLWLVLGIIGGGILASWLMLPIAELNVMKTLAAVVYLLIFPFVWSMQARFESTVVRTLRNAVLVAIGRLPLAVGVLLVQGAVAAITIATWLMLPQALVLLLLLGYPFAVWASMPLMERALAVLLPTAEDPAPI